MKTCSRCKEEKPFDQFHKQTAKKDGLQPYCKACKKASYAEYYATDKERQRLLALKKRSVATRNELLNEIKSVPCADCAVQYPPYVMDFDHLGDKKFNISSDRHKALPTVMAEIEKCEIVCSNCHRERTQQRLRQ